jgi:hypothetical protein
MFGTIGHARVKPGHEAQLDGMLQEWKDTIRPSVPGPFLELSGHRAGNASDIVFLALAKDEATYRSLADMPDQDAFYRRMVEHLDAEPTWEDVEMDVIVPL